MTQIKINARQEIRAAAEANGWTVTKDYGWYVEFVREAPIGPKFAASRAAGGIDWTPATTVKVYYSELVGGRSFVTNAYLYAFSSQSALTGHYVGAAKMVEGKDRRGQVVGWLTEEVVVTP
jgi:hypothetical protein